MDTKRKLTDLFGWGNAKMGKKVLTFSIPAVSTCPGSTETCRKVCYASTGFFRMNSVQSKYGRCFDFTKTEDFVPVAIALLQTVPEDTLFRLHVAGDFYDAEYVRKWTAILKANPHLTTWVYTRSWRITDIYPEIVKLSKLTNLKVWFSVDKETGKPTRIPPGVRLAYMMVTDDDIPTYKPDLYFRDGSARGVVVKHIKGGIVCPHENGITKNITCEKCKLCFRPEPLPTFTSEGGFKGTSKRLALQTV